jgi:antitoxin PrlF
MKKEGAGTSGADVKSKKGCCEISAVVTVDERGQMVLPKGVRDALNIKAGDKLAVVVMGSEGKRCCISLMKVDELEDGVRSKLGPVLDEIVKGR